MNIAEYTIELESRSEWVSGRKELTDTLDDVLTSNATLRLYAVLLLVELKNGTYQGARQDFYVLDEGTEQEAVYPINQERESESVNPFLDQLQTYVETRITATRVKITLDIVNEAEEFAIVTAYEVDAQDIVSPKQYFVAKDDQGAPYIKAFVA